MESPLSSSSSVGHHSINIPISPVSSPRVSVVSPENTIKSVMVLTKQKLNLSQTSSSSTVDNVGFASSVPVTPDPNSSSKKSSKSNKSTTKSAEKERGCHVKLNKFVRRLHDMLLMERDSGIVEWRRGLLVLFSTDAFSKTILPKYFNTRNFKTFRRQLNYYGFVHVRSFGATGNTTTVLWINQNLADDEANIGISAVLKLRRVEPNEVAKTVEGRRLRKELAIHTVEEDIGLSSKTLQFDQIRSMAIRGEIFDGGQHAALLSPRHTSTTDSGCISSTRIPREVLHVPTDSENSMTSSASTHHTNYSSNDDDESAGSVVQLLSTIEETANTDAAASVLLMLSRS